MSRRAAERQPWEHRSGESSPAYRAFAHFRDMGEDRTIAATARELGKSESLLRRWAARHEWWPRVREWDLENEREERALARRERAESRRQRLRYARQMQALAMLGLSNLVQRDPMTGETTLVGELTPRDSAALMRLGVDLEDGLVPPADEQTAATDSTEALLQRRPDADLKRLLDLIEEQPQPEEEGEHASE
jgi:hypothetical protein